MGTTIAIHSLLTSENLGAANLRCQGRKVWLRVLGFWGLRVLGIGVHDFRV